LQVAADTPRNELEEQVQGVLQQNTYCPDDGRLADIDRKLSLVRLVTPVGLAHLERIQATVAAPLAQARTEASLEMTRARTIEVSRTNMARVARASRARRSIGGQTGTTSEGHPTDRG
jgi:hypothetical protein